MKVLKYKSLKYNFSIVLLLSFVLGFSHCTSKLSTNKKTPHKFLILIERTENGLKLTSSEGCAWSELSFTISQDMQQTVSQLGMTTPDQTSTKDNNGLYDFLIVFTKTKDGISLVGKKGTAWTQLKFTCPVGNCHQYIDLSGMI